MEPIMDTLRSTWDFAVQLSPWLKVPLTAACFALVYCFFWVKPPRADGAAKPQSRPDLAQPRAISGDNSPSITTQGDNNITTVVIHQPKAEEKPASVGRLTPRITDTLTAEKLAIRFGGNDYVAAVGSGKSS